MNALAGSTSDCYLATTVDANDLASGSDYIIYTVINGTYYVLTSDGSLEACTPASSLDDVTGDGPYYIESTGMILYGSSSTTYAGSQWTLTESGSDSSYYYAKNTGTGAYLAASGNGSGSDITTGSGLSSQPHSGVLTFYGDFTLTYSFTNKCNGTLNSDNYVVEMVSNGVYVDVRSDNYGWLYGADASDTLTFDNGSSDWDAWLSTMKAGTDATVTITRTGTAIVVKTTAAGETFAATAYVSEYADDAALTVYLTGENCTISEVTYTATVNTVQLTDDSTALTCGATGATLSGTPLSVIASVSNNALAWADSTGTAGTVFYFAEVQTVGDNYHFMETVTLTDAAENQDDSYIVYTKINDTYYVVSAVDGSLLECTDLSSYTDEDEKVLLSTAAGAYIWSYDSEGEPEFKFTTGTDDNDVDYFEDYRWYVSSSDYDTTSGTGNYTLYNEENNDYLAAGLYAETIAKNGSTDTSSTMKMDAYGTMTFSVTEMAASSSYYYLQMTITDSGNTSRYLRLNMVSDANNSGYVTVSENRNYLYVSGSTSGYMYLNANRTDGVLNTLTVTVTITSDALTVTYVNTDGQSIVYTVGYNFSSGISVSFWTTNGSYQITPTSDNIANYVRVSLNSDPVTMTAVTGANSTSASSNASYYWTAGNTVNNTNFSLIAQLAADIAGTAEIDWVTDTTAGTTATGTATITLTNAAASTLSDTVALTFSLARVRQYTVHFDPTNGATATSNTDYNATVYYYEDGSATAATQAASSGSCAVTSYSDAVGNCYIRLATALSSDNYPYDLQGWYDIYNNIYYSAAFAGEELSITDNTVMYADWVIGSDYQAMDGTETGALAEENKLDTTGFITTEVFDYNSLVNLYSATLYGTVTGTSSSTGTATYSTYVNARDHLELWGLAADPLTTYSSYATTTNILGTTSWGFLFINNRAGTNSLYTGLERVGSLSYLLGRNDNGYNAGFKQEITTKIYADTGVDLFTMLFNRSNGYTPSSTLGGTGTGTLGVNYLGTGNYLYQYDDDTGYYYYDSSKNAAYYYNNRFYLFECTVKGNASGTEDDFLPFNYPTITDNNGSYSASTIAYSNTNYFFGMKSTVSFYLPDDTGTVNASNTTGYGNMSDAGDKMVFRFMGDDDVWVYVDDELTLDLGGTHGAIYGEIDFSVGTVSYITNTTEIAVDDAGNTKPYVDLCFDTSSDVLKLDEDIVYENGGKLYIKVEAVTGTNRVYYRAVSSTTATSSTVTAVEVGYTQYYSTEAGTHTLYFYYMERGGSESNCKIYFSLSSTTYSLDLTKVDESGNTYGTDAKFSIYTKDSNETLNILPLIETGSTETRLATSDDDENDYVYTFTSSQEISGLREGILYYVYEVDSPDGLTAAGRYFTIILEGDVLTITVYDSSGEKLDIYEYLLTITGDVTNGYTATYTAGSNTSLSSDSWKYVDTSNMTVVPTVAGQTVTNYKIAFGFKIVNTKEYELPATGSVGITPYIQTGKLLVMVAVLGLAMIAFYGLVRARRCRTAKYKEEGTKEKGGRKRSCVGTRDRPQKRGLGHGHARGHPQDR